MRKIHILLVLTIALANCEKTNVEVTDIYDKVELSKHSEKADGKSEVTVTINLADGTSADRRNVILTLNNGSFGSGDIKKTTAKAEYENGKLVATATIRMPTSGDWVKVTATPEFDSSIKEYSLSDSLKLTRSSADSLRLETSAYGIKSNFKSEVKLTAYLLGGENPVSAGERVVFNDTITNSAVHGKYRKLQASTGDSSKVTTYYAAPSLSVGTTITITASYINASGLKTGKPDTLVLTINE